MSTFSWVFSFLMVLSLNVQAIDQEDVSACLVCGWRPDVAKYTNEHLFKIDKGQCLSFCCYPLFFSVKTINSEEHKGCEVLQCDGFLASLLCFFRPTCYYDCSFCACFACLQGTNKEKCFCAWTVNDTGCIYEVLKSGWCCSKKCGDFRCEGCDDLDKEACCTGCLKNTCEFLGICCLAILEGVFAGSD